MTTYHLAAVVLALVAFATGCSDDDTDDEGNGSGSGGSAGTGGGSGSGFLGSCDTRSVDGPSMGQCRDWNGDGNADLSVSCDGLDGAFSLTEPCPSGSRVGTCALGPLLGIVAIYNYYEPDYTTADAQDHCEALDGTFDG